MKKRGSHVGFVLSFMVFVFFLFFLYVAIEPAVKSNENKKVVFEYLKTEILARSYDEFIQSSTKLNDGIDLQGASCFNINFEDLEKTGAVVKDENNIQASKVSGNSLSISDSNPSDKFYRIYFANSFKNSEMENCFTLAETDYTIGSLQKKDYIFENKIVTIINKHVSNYSGLRADLKVQEGADFSLIFTEENGNEIKTEDKEVTTDIYAEKIPIIYVDSEANIKSGSLTIKVW